MRFGLKVRLRAAAAFVALSTVSNWAIAQGESSTSPVAPNESVPTNTSTGASASVPANTTANTPTSTPTSTPAITTPAVVQPTTTAEPPTRQPAVNVKSNLLNLSAQATLEVANDVMTVTYSAVKEGTDAQAVQATLKQSLDVALAEARKAARPGQIEVETGNFSLSPRYTPPGWQGRAELVTTGKDQAGIAKIAGRIQTMSVTRVVHSLSRDAREKAEAEATAQAVTKFRARAAEVTRLFGFSSFEIREINVATSETGGEVPMVRARMTAAAPMADVALPAEAGRGTVTVVVNGGVEMR